jgi:hypothetical protein
MEISEDRPGNRLDVERQEGIISALARSRIWQEQARHEKWVTDESCLFVYLRIQFVAEMHMVCLMGLRESKAEKDGRSYGSEMICCARTQSSGSAMHWSIRSV